MKSNRKPHALVFLAVFGTVHLTCGQAATFPRPTVRAVAQNPAAHLGKLSLSGVVGIVTPRKGFVLVDMNEYRAEGLSCLTTSEKTKIPVVWRGSVPEIKQTVIVDGTLTKTAHGYLFTASKVSP